MTRILAMITAMALGCSPEPCPGAWTDLDGDGFGDPGTHEPAACELQPGQARRGGDCDDLDPTVAPGAEERCDGIDSNCDGAGDDGAVDAVIRYLDGDGDGYGAEAVVTCDANVGVVRGGDCDDTLDSVHPGAIERCDHVDQDCDGEVDDDPIDGQSFFVDADGDGWGSDVTIEACFRPDDGATRDGDCDDTRSDVHPAAQETACDGIDSNCDGLGAVEVATLRWEPYPTVGAAVADAADGDRVWICPGVIDEAITLVGPGSLTLAGWTDNADDVVFTGSSGPALTVSGGFHLTLLDLGFVDTVPLGQAVGGAIAVGDADLTIEDCVFSGNRAFQGGAIGIDADAATADRTVAISTSRFTDNHAAHGGAIALKADASTDFTTRLVVDGTTFEANVADAAERRGSSRFSVPQGGAIGVLSYAPFELEVADTTFDAGDAGHGGGIAVQSMTTGTASVHLADSVFTEQSASRWGGALFVTSPASTGTTVQLDVQDTTFTDNSAAMNGGALRLYAVRGDLDITIAGSTFDGNEAATIGGAIELATTGIGSDVTFTVDQSTFVRNRAGRGGALRLDPYDAVIRLTDTTFEDNTSTWEGGAILAELNDADPFAIDGCTFSVNRAGTRGGAVVLDGPTRLDMDDTIFEANEAGTSGGGLVLQDPDAVDLATCTFEDNVAGAAGGGLWLENGSASLDSIAFLGNQAATGAGLYASNTSEGASLSLVSLTFDANAATSGGAAWIGSGGWVVGLATSEVLGNTGDGFVLEDDATLYVDGSDWGEGADDNTTWDVVFGTESTSDLGSDETFTCGASGCTW